MELTICIKMNLVLNNLQRLLCHKTQTTNQLSNLILIICLHTVKWFQVLLFSANNSFFVFNLFKLKNYSINLKYSDTKIRQPLHMTYWTTGQLFRPYKVSSSVYTMISPTGDWTSNHKMQSRNHWATGPYCIKWCQMNWLINLICFVVKSVLLQLIGQVGRVFANGLVDLGSIPGRVIPKTLKMVLDTSLLNTQQYKIHIEGKVEQSRERSSTLPYTSVL